MGNKQNTTKKQSQVLKFRRQPPQQQQTPEQQIPSSHQLGEILLQLTSQGDVSRVKNLLDQGADKNYLNQGGQSPMYIALAYGHADLFQFLYLQGAQIIPEVEYNGSPLHAAVKFGHQELCQMFLQENGQYPEYQNMKDDRGYTPLHLACLKGNINLVKLLLRAKAQIEVRGKDGKTPLSICIENMHKDIQSLLESSVQKNSIVENNHLTHKRDISSIMLESAENNQENLQNYLEKKLNDSSSYLPVIPAKELTYLDQINKGSSCLLYRGRWRQSEVAIKQFKIEYSQGKKELKKFIKELSVLMAVRHPHLLLLMGVSIDGPNLCLITEYVDNNTLFYALHKNKKRKLTSQERLKIAIQIAKGMLYLHYNEPPIVHRDLKPENCLLDRAYNVKIADFGLARPLIYLQGEVQENTTTCIGTTRFMAPELFDKKFTQLSPEVDVWSYGCLMIEIFSNKRPWSHISSANTNCIYYEIFKKKPVPIPETIDLPLRELIRKCLSYEPQERPNMEIILLALENYAEQIKSAN